MCEQQDERQRLLPSVEQYSEERRRNGGVAINIALIEYVFSNLFVFLSFEHHPLLDTYTDLTSHKRS